MSTNFPGFIAGGVFVDYDRMEYVTSTQRKDLEDQKEIRDYITEEPELFQRQDYELGVFLDKITLQLGTGEEKITYGFFPIGNELPKHRELKKIAKDFYSGKVIRVYRNAKGDIDRICCKIAHVNTNHKVIGLAECYLDSARKVDRFNVYNVCRLQKFDMKEMDKNVKIVPYPDEETYEKDRYKFLHEILGFPVKPVKANSRCVVS